jgi:O-antigen/teichoic acid export membrane protein
MVTNSLMQSLHKPKLIYTSVFSGLIANLALDIPLMTLFSHWNLPAYYGAVTATLCGFTVSNTICLSYLNRKMGFRYKETLYAIPRWVISVVVLVALLIFFNQILPTEHPSKGVQIGNLLLSGSVCAGGYFFMNFRQVLTLLPQKIQNRFERKNKTK